MNKVFRFPVFLFLVAGLLRLILAPFGTLELDFSTFRAWSDLLFESGLSSFYTNWSDYLPGYLYVLWFLALAKALVPVLGQGVLVYVLYKLPAILADLATGGLIYWVVLRLNPRLASFAAAIYLFNPAVLANSTLWGQVDGITSLFAFAGMAIAPINGWVSAALLAFGTLVKPQAAFITPFLAYLWWRKFGPVKMVAYGIFSSSLFLAGFLPFLGQEPLVSFVLERLNTTAGQYPYTSVNAFNIWAFADQMWKSDVNGLLSPQVVGIVLTEAVTLGIITYLVLRSKNNASKEYLVVALIFLASFLFLTRMHERHLLPTFASLAVAASVYPILYIPYAMLSFTYLANLNFSYVWITEDFREIFSPPLVDVFVLANIMAFVIMGFIFMKQKTVSSIRFVGLLKQRLSLQVISGSMGWIEYNKNLFLTLILMFAFVSRIVWLDKPPQFYFDEVYHAFTAQEILKGNPKAWEWWNTPPEGVAYEWTHPPLAKLAMVVSMKIFGVQAIGWRFPSALFGTGVVLLVYLLGKHLFKKETPAIIAAGVFALDGLPLVLSRIGMNDTYFVFFALLAILLFLKEKFFFSSLVLGFAAASKWTTLWIFPVLILAIFLFGKKPRFMSLWFLVTPPIIYFLSYTPFFLSGHTLDQFIELQRQMWFYHTNLQATHAFQSSWWSWPLMIRPVWLFTQASDGLAANIYAMGNPLVFWLGFGAMLGAIIEGMRLRSSALLFIAGAWGLMFLPWAFSPRIMFLYHYLPAVPFISLALGWWLSKQTKVFLITGCLLLLASYLFFFPHWTGTLVPRWLDSLYYWFPSWKW